MIEQALLGHLLVLGTRTAVVGEGIDADATTRGEEARDLNVLGVHESDEVFHDDVDAVLVEVAVIAEGEEVEFEAFALDHAAVGDVGDADLGEVGLARNGAQRGELRAVETYPVVVVGMSVLEGFQHFGGVVLPILGLPS